MWKYLLSRFIQIAITLFVFFALTYFILDAQPGDITLQYIDNPRFTEEQRLALQRRLGLDRPVTERFLHWLGNTLKGNLGDSYIERRPVMDIIRERAPRTVFLFLTATMIEFFVGYFLGKLLAWGRGSAMEYSVTVVGAITYTIFTPWFALIMIWLFGFIFHWFPLGKFLDPNIWRKIPVEAGINANIIFNNLLFSATLVVFVMMVVFALTIRVNPRRATIIRWSALLFTLTAAFVLWGSYQYGYLAWDIIWHMILPVITLTIINFSGTMLLTRTTMLETLREDYIVAARAKGLPERVVRDKHAARNALLPVFTNLMLTLPFIMAGGIITETIFSWPGMGLTLLQASNSGDIPMVMGAFMFIGGFSLLAHLITDITYAYLDPRIRYS